MHLSVHGNFQLAVGLWGHNPIVSQGRSILANTITNVNSSLQLTYTSHQPMQLSSAYF